MTTILRAASTTDRWLIALRLVAHVLFFVGHYVWAFAFAFWTMRPANVVVPMRTVWAERILHAYPLLFLLGFVLAGWRLFRPPEPRWRVAFAFLPLLSFVGYWLVLGRFRL